MKNQKLKTFLILITILFSSLIPITITNFTGLDTSNNDGESIDVNLKTSEPTSGVWVSYLAISGCTDANVQIDLKFYVKCEGIVWPLGIFYHVTGFIVYFKSADSSGKWNDWTIMLNNPFGLPLPSDGIPGDGLAVEYTKGPYYITPRSVENDVQVRVDLIYDHIGVQNGLVISTERTIDLRDDDTTPPTISGEIRYPWWYLWLPTPLTNGMTYDISDIPMDQYDDWSIRVYASDPSGVEIQNRDESWSIVTNYVEYTIEEALNSAAEVNSNIWPDTLDYPASFRDRDVDRGGDIDQSETSVFYKFIIRYYYGATGHSNAAVTKIDVFEPSNDVYFEATEGVSTTTVTRYKKDGQKNEVKISLDVRNRYDHKERIKFGIKIYDIKNVIYHIDDSEFYTYSDNQYDIYYGDLDERNVFRKYTYDDGIAGDIMYFWVHLEPHETKSIDLFTVKIDNMKLLDEEMVLSEDFKDLGLGLYGIIPDVMDIKSTYKNLQEFSNLVNRVQDKSEHGDLVSDLINWYDLWTKYSSILDDPGGHFIFNIYVAEAYMAKVDLQDPEYWIWRINSEDDNDPYHYTRQNADDTAILNNMVYFNPELFREDPNVDGLYYCGIGFIPGRDQQDAFLGYIMAEVLSDFCYLAGTLTTSYLYSRITPILAIILSCLLFIVGGVIDIAKNVIFLQIANGIDPPDSNYYEKPNNDLVEFPYEEFPELSDAIDNNVPVALKGKSIVDNLLEYERTSANIFTSINRFNTSYTDGNYSATVLQSDYINEFSVNGNELSKELDEDFISFFEEINTELDTDITSFDQEKLEIIENDHFSIDPRFMSFTENYRIKRNLDDTIIRNFEKTEQVINNIAVEDKDLINNAVKESFGTYDKMQDISNSIIESNTHAKVYISKEKLNIDPSNNEDTLLKLDELKLKLDLQAQLILDGRFFQSINIGEELQSESIQLYHDTLDQSFMEIYKASYNMMSTATKANQLEMKLIDLPTKTIINGDSVDYDFTILNLASDSFINSNENVIVEFSLANLPLSLNHKIYENGIELEKTNDGSYYIEFIRHETKKLTLELIIPQNSILEPKSYNFILNATSEGIIYKYSEIELNFNLLDDDVTPPEIEYQYVGNYKDSNPGNIIVNAYDLSGLSLDPSGTYIVPNELGIHEFNFIAIDDDNDYPQDTLKTTETFIITITDDDILAPQITDLEINNTIEDLFITFYAYDDGSGDDSGLSLINIYIDGEVVLTEIPPEDQNYFEFKISNQWKDQPGYYTIKIEVWDSDNDRTQDSIMQEEYGTFEIANNIPNNPSGNSIPGYDILLIITIVGFTVMIILNRKRKAIKI